MIIAGRSPDLYLLFSKRLARPSQTKETPRPRTRRREGLGHSRRRHSHRFAASVAWRPSALLAGAVGVGLVVAAVTDTCAMGSLLARLPFNRRRSDGCDLPQVVSHLTTTQEVTA